MIAQIDLWEILFGAYGSGLTPGLFYAMLIGVFSLAIYTKTRSAGTTFAAISLMCLAFSSLIPGFAAHLFRIAAGAAFGLLMWTLYKGRGGY